MFILALFPSNEVTVVIKFLITKIITSWLSYHCRDTPRYVSALDPRNIPWTPLKNPSFRPTHTLNHTHIISGRLQNISIQMVPIRTCLVLSELTTLSQVMARFNGCLDSTLISNVLIYTENYLSYI